MSDIKRTSGLYIFKLVDATNKTCYFPLISHLEISKKSWREEGKITMTPIGNVEAGKKLDEPSIFRNIADVQTAVKEYLLDLKVNGVDLYLHDRQRYVPPFAVDGRYYYGSKLSEDAGVSSARLVGRALNESFLLEDYTRAGCVLVYVHTKKGKEVKTRIYGTENLMDMIKSITENGLDGYFTFGNKIGYFDGVSTYLKKYSTYFTEKDLDKYYVITTNKEGDEKRYLMSRKQYIRTTPETLIPQRALKFEKIEDAESFAMVNMDTFPNKVFDVEEIVEPTTILLTHDGKNIWLTNKERA